MQRGDGLDGNYREKTVKALVWGYIGKIFRLFTHIALYLPDVYYMGPIKTQHDRRQVQKGTVNRQSWLRFLEAITRWEDEARLINGQRLISQTDSRALYRWEMEGATPTWIRVDEFLCPYDLIFTDFEIWCFCEKVPLWEKDPPEGWD